MCSSDLIETGWGHEIGGEHFTVGVLRCDGIEPIFSSCYEHHFDAGFAELVGDCFANAA